MTRSNSLALIALTVAVPALSGCLSTAASIVTAPVRVASKGVDMLTTSQSEADEKRGRALRKRDERIGRLQHEHDRYQRECMRGSEEACDRAREEYGEIQNLRATGP